MDVVKEGEFLLLGVKEVIELLSSDDINVPDEEAVFDILCHWINYDVDKRRGFVSDLLPCVHMRFLSPSFIADKIETNEWFWDDPTCKELISNVIQCHALPEMWEKRNLNGMKVKQRSKDKDNMYAVGGRGVETIERYSYENNNWIKVGEMRSGRYAFGAAVIDNNIWIVGGCDSNHGRTSSCECWNPRTGEWHDIAPMNTSCEDLGVGVLEGILYAVGGYDGSKYLKSMEKWNPNMKTWSKVDENMTPLAEMSTGRRGLGVAVLKGMYI